MSGPKIAALYGLIPNRLGFCGPRQEILKKFVAGKLGIVDVISVLEKFEAAYAYYDLIARKNKIKTGPFNKKVVEAYWIGNELLEKVTANDLRQLIIKKFTKPGLLSKKEAEIKAKSIPENSKPHHSFHVLILGSITGRVDFTGDIKLKDTCRVGWGRVIKKAKGKKLSSSRWLDEPIRQKAKITVQCHPLVGEKIIRLGRAVKKEVIWDQEILPFLKKGDWVSLHWNHTIQILREKDIINLHKYTQNTLDGLYEK
jgi:hypothetical protein